jgi:lysyl-tRNA synthetase class 2
VTRGGEAEILRERREKLERLRAMGVNPFPYRYQPTHTAAEVVAGFDSLAAAETELHLAGRVLVMRDHGKTSFFHLQDASGKIQVYARRDELGEEAWERFRLLEAGDIVGVRGPVFRTRTEEITIRAAAVTLLAKALRPLPEKWHGLRDVEARSRQRYLDLVANEESREVFRKRTLVFSAVRRFLEERGFVEVDTPILQPLYGGAMARPFETHHNALDMTLYLRIANELYLKRLIVGGMDRVFEFARDFRNEGMDRTHNPEFTQVELYQAWADYHDMMEICEGLVAAAAMAANGTMRLRYGDRETDVAPPWPRKRLTDMVAEKVDAPVLDLEMDELRALALRHGLAGDGERSRGEIIEELFETLIQPDLVGPLFVLDFPRETSPLAKQHRDDPRLAERFEPMIFGTEMGNAFSELNDPDDQERAMREQARWESAHGEKGQPVDEDYLRALQHGMPPTGGLGVGMDRLVMLLTGCTHIRDVILFPHLRPESGREEEGKDEGAGDAHVG